MKPAEVRREVDDAARREILGDEFEQFSVVALHVPRRLALRGAGERRRIADDEIERGLAPLRPVLQKCPGLVPHRPVPPGILEGVLREVRPRPVDIRVGKIDARRLHSPSRRRVDGETPRVAEEIEESFSCRLGPHHRAGLAMVKKQARVEIVGEVHLELQAALPHREHRLALADLLILPAGPLPLPHLEKSLVHWHAEFERRGLDHLVEPHVVLDLRAFMRPLILGRMQPAGVPVDHKRNLGNVAIVDPKRLDALAAGPLGEMLETLREPAAKIADLIGDGPRALADRRRPHGHSLHGVIARARGDRGREGTLTPALSRRESGAGGGRRTRAFADLDFEQAARDRAVHERNAMRRPQAEVADRWRVGSEDRRPPATALLHEPVANPAKEGGSPRQREPLAVGRIRDHETGRACGPHFFEVMLRDRDATRHPRRLGTRPRRFDGLHIEIAGHERHIGYADTCLEFRHEPLGQGLVAIAKPKKSVRFAAGTPQAWRHPRGDRRRLHHERA